MDNKYPPEYYKDEKDNMKEDYDNYGYNEYAQQEYN